MQNGLPVCREKEKEKVIPVDFLSILMQMVELFLVIIVGYIANKCGVMDGDFNKRLTNLVLMVTMPCLILDSVINSEHVFPLGQIGSILLISMLGYALAAVLAYLMTWLMHTPPRQEGVMRFMLIFGNVGFIGFPVIKAIFGSDAVFYAAILNMPSNLLSYTFGVFLMAGRGSETKLRWKDFCSPCIIAALLALIIALAQLQFPAIVGDTVSLIGQVTTPAALLIIGSNLAQLPLRSIAGGPRIWLMSLIRLLICPALLWLLLRGWVTDDLILGVAIVIQGMPVATSCTMLALQYGGDAESAGQGTFVSALLSIVTIPILTLLV